MTQAPPGESRPLSTIFALRRDPLGWLERIAAQYGDLAQLRVGPYRLVFVNHPDLIHEVLVTKDASFVKGRVLDQARDVFGQGLLTSEGDFHRRQRKLIQPAFHRRRIEAYANAMAADAAAAAERWRDGETVDVAREMMRLTLRIVARSLFSVDVEDESAREAGRALDALVAAFSLIAIPGANLLQKLPIPSYRRARHARETLDALVYRMIAERRRGSPAEGGEDLLSLLLDARDEEGGGGMDDRQVRDEVLTLFLAGHETTANALAWSWYLLAGHPEAEARFHAEIDSALGDRLPGAADLPALPYTRKVLAESMRLYPPAGPRICIGMGFAWMEGVLLLSTLGRRWSMRLVPGHPVEPSARITLRPKHGVRVTLRRR